MLPAPMESSRHQSETIGADGGETSKFVQSAQRQTALAKLKPSEEVECIGVESLRRRISWSEEEGFAVELGSPEEAVAGIKRMTNLRRLARRADFLSLRIS